MIASSAVQIIQPERWLEKSEGERGHDLSILRTSGLSSIPQSARSAPYSTLSTASSRPEDGALWAVLQHILIRGGTTADDQRRLEIGAPNPSQPVRESRRHPACLSHRSLNARIFGMYSGRLLMLAALCWSRRDSVVVKMQQRALSVEESCLGRAPIEYERGGNVLKMLLGLNVVVGIVGVTSDVVCALTRMEVLQPCFYLRHAMPHQEFLQLPPRWEQNIRICM
jgi:hypothetical protein